MKMIKGSDLRAMRMVAGQTTVAMAQAAGVKTRKTYENWEKGQGAPNVNQFIALVTACGFKPSEIMMNYEGEAKGQPA